LEGIVKKKQVNNTKPAHEFWEYAAKVVAERGGNLTSITTEEIYQMETEKRGAEWVEKHLKGKTPNAYYLPDGTIAINVRSKQARRFLLGHEITHDIEEAFKKQLAEAKENGVDAVDGFGRFKQMMFDYERSVTSNEAFEKRLAETAEKYGGINADAESELLADLVGEHLYSDGKFIEHLSTQDRNLFQRVWDKVQYLYKMATAGSQEASDLERIKREFERVYRESAKIKTDAKGDTKAENFYDSSAKYSLTVTDKATLDFLDNQDTITTYKTIHRAGILHISFDSYHRFFLIRCILIHK
jgi:hypothetical protein